MHHKTWMLALAATLLLASGAIAAETSAPAAVRSFQLSYSFTVKDVPADAKSIKVWVPVPQSNPYQTIGKMGTESSNRSAMSVACVLWTGFSNW